MEPKARLRFSLISGIVIVAVSVAIAYVCFKILDSSATATLKQWKLGGAFAGFVFTASLLTSIVFQFYKQMTSETVDSYRSLIEELQAKLIKGAPCPDDFSIDIDERHKLVFARPDSWRPRGGVLYQYVEPRKSSDFFAANFNVTFSTQNELKKAMGDQFDPEGTNQEALYEKAAQSTVAGTSTMFDGYEQVSLTREYVQVDGLKSLKMIHTYRIQRPQAADSDPKVEIRQTSVITYVPRVKALYNFTFSDDSTDYLVSSEVFSKVTSSIRFLG